MIIFQIVTSNLSLISGLERKKIVLGDRPAFPKDIDIPQFLKDTILNCWEQYGKNRHNITLIYHKIKYENCLIKFSLSKNIKTTDDIPTVVNEKIVTKQDEYDTNSNFKQIKIGSPENYKTSLSVICDKCGTKLKRTSFWHCDECNFDLCEKCKNVDKIEHDHTLNHYSGKKIYHVCDSQLCCKNCKKTDFKSYFYLKKDNVLCPDCYSKKICKNNDYICCKSIKSKKFEDIEEKSYLFFLFF
jgi:hypothetical protein